MVDLKEICDRLKYLGTQPETPEARAEVEAAFDMKWEGVQAVAVRTMGVWGGRRSVEFLQRWLFANNENSSYYMLGRVIVEALEQCHELRDLPWILDLYYGSSHSAIGDLTRTLRFPETHNSIIEETRNAIPERRKAALNAVYLLELDNACQVFGEMRSDEDQEIREMATLYFNEQCNRQVDS